VENLFRAPKHKRTLSFIQTLQDEPNGDILNPEDFEGTLFRLTYKDESTKDWILNDCIKKYDVNVNVLAGKINTINESAVGYLIIEMRGEDTEILLAKKYLEEKDVNVEVM
ncbi:MAG: methionine ABC transporter ATP-binding protein, partial [Tissierellia bacterium]|nr:methionine ABC transporter ATP-binding protein [Tissierellia bacterium]